MKNQVGTVDAIPSKRVFLSIIADYDLNRSVCELIDNALDIVGGRQMSTSAPFEKLWLCEKNSICRDRLWYL
jgi:hypothetical protein